MKHRVFHFTFFASILFLLLICQRKSSLAAGPTLLPEQHFYDVKYYGLNLQVDPDTQFIQGSVEIGGEIVQDATSRILLNFYDHMTVDSVQMTGQPLSFTHGADILTIVLPQPLNTGDSFTLQVFYHGYPMQAGLPGYGLIFTSYNGQKLVYSYNWPYYASTWFPCKDHPSDKADSVVLAITVPDNYQVACNGKSLSTNALPNNLIQFKWVTHYPIVTYNISVNIHPFDVVHSSYTSTTSGTFPLEFFLFPNHTPTAQPQLEWVVPRIQEVYEHRYGAFPFVNEKYGICEAVISGGMEHQTLLIMNYPSFFSDIVVHESAHEYFGNMISLADWGHIWLNEGFATYSEAIYQEYWNGEAAYRQEISQNMAGSGEGAIFVYDPSTPGNIIPYSLVYLKASVVLHMLRYVMGDSLFFQMLHDYVMVSPFRYKNIDTGQFRQFCESYYGSDLGWFFNQWIYKDGKMAADYYHYWSSPGDTLYFKIHSKPSTPNSSTYHAMPVPLQISAFMSQLTDTLWIDSLGSNTFYLLPDTTDLQIEFDPENKILKGPFDQKSFPEIDSLDFTGDSIGVFWQPFFDFTHYLLKVYFEQNGVWQLVRTAVAQGNHYFFHPQQTGNYGFQVAAQQNGHTTRFSPMRTMLYTNFPMNQGILIVDETRNSNGSNMWNPTDATVDAFYDSLFSGYPHQQFDILAENRPLSVLDLAPYGLIVWHHDVPNNSFLSQSQSALTSYLQAGGKIIFSGLKILNSLTPDFSSQYLGIQGFQLISQADFAAAAGGTGFSNLPLDTTKITVPFYQHRLPNTMIFDTSATAETIYRYQSGGALPQFQNQPCGVLAREVNDSTRFVAVALGFPLYFTQMDAAGIFVNQALQVLNPPVKIDERGRAQVAVSPLMTVFPNPFNASTTVRLTTRRKQAVVLSVYNILGQKVRTLFAGNLAAGSHRFFWNGQGENGTPLSSGVYLLRLQAGNKRKSIKILLQK